MTAEFKSHVLHRDEKGFAGIPFKRLLLGGVAGGLSYTLFRIALPEVAVALGIGTTLFIIILTAPGGGLALWRRLWLRWRGVLLLRASRHPDGVLGESAQMLNLPVELARLDSTQVFAPPTALIDVDLREWVTFAHARDLDSGNGLVFVDSPLAGDIP